VKECHLFREVIFMNFEHNIVLASKGVSSVIISGLKLPQ
jgi:hypothetical protein